MRNLLRRIGRLLSRPKVEVVLSATPEGAARLEALRKLGYLEVLSPTTPSFANPVDHIGTALRLAEAYGIRLTGGITYGNARAYLPTELWRVEANVDYMPKGDWVDRLTVQEAICDCILSCHQIGILRPDWVAEKSGEGGNVHA